MKKKIIRLISIFLISLLLFKGLIPVIPSFSSSLKDFFTKEPLAEPESEQQKKGISEKFELNSGEELFDHVASAIFSLHINGISANREINTGNNLPIVCLDIPTPPPNRF